MIRVGQVSFDLSAPLPGVTIAEPGPSRDSHRAIVSKLQERKIRLPEIRVRLEIVMLKDGAALPILATRQRKLADWPLTRGLYHGNLGDSYGWTSWRWSKEGRDQDRRTAEEMAKSGRPRPATSRDLLLYRRFEGGVPGFDVCDTGRYRLGAYLRLATIDATLERLGYGRRSTRPGGFSRTFDRASETENANRLAAEELKTIEVQDGRRTHFRLTSSADMEADTLAVLESATTQEQVDALLERTWPVTIEELGFEDMILPQSTK